MQVKELTLDRSLQIQESAFQKAFWSVPASCLRNFIYKHPNILAVGTQRWVLGGCGYPNCISKCTVMIVDLNKHRPAFEELMKRVVKKANEEIQTPGNLYIIRETDCMMIEERIVKEHQNAFTLEKVGEHLILLLGDRVYKPLNRRDFLISDGRVILRKSPVSSKSIWRCVKHWKNRTGNLKKETLDALATYIGFPGGWYDFLLSR